MKDLEEMEEMELKISRFLRLGVIISGLMIAVGWIFTLKWEANILTHYQEYDPIPLKNFLTYQFNQGNWPVMLSYGGLMVLISLPLIRVFLTGVLFIRQKDYMLAAIAGLVLLCLIVSFSFGIDL